MKKTIKSHRSLMGLIYALFMLFPLLSFANRFLYTVFNDNAFESYYGETINEEILNDVTSLDTSSTYLYNSNNLTTLFTGNSTIYLSSFSNPFSDNSGSNTQLVDNASNIKILIFLNNGTSNPYISFRDANNETLTNVSTANRIIRFNFTVESYDIGDTSLYSYIKHVSYNNYSYLDNNFEYSMYLFTENHGTGVLDLTSWFTNQFISADDTHAMLYINFINWYMNYTLLVSCVYLLYAVLMWFLTWARRILSKGLDEGGIY